MMHRTAIWAALATALARPLPALAEPATWPEAGFPELAQESARKAAEGAFSNPEVAPDAIETPPQRRSWEPKLFDAGAYFAGLGGELIAVGLTVGLASGVYLSLRPDSCRGAPNACDPGPEELFVVLLAAAVGTSVATVATPLLSTGLAWAAGRAGRLEVNFRAAYGIGYAGLGLNVTLTAGAMAIALAASHGDSEAVLGTGIVVGAVGLLVTPWLQSLALEQPRRVIVAPLVTSRSAGLAVGFAF